MSRPPRRTARPAADVEIEASARADRVRFARPPEAEASFEAEESGSHGERENIPGRVEPHVTYRDVRVRWHGWARIVAPAPEPGQGD